MTKFNWSKTRQQNVINSRGYTSVITIAEDMKLRKERIERRAKKKTKKQKIVRMKFSKTFG